MSAATLPPPAKPRPQLAPTAPPTRKTWTVRQFHDLWTRGEFGDNRVSLVNGEIYEMAIPGPPHNLVVGRADYRFKAIFGPGYWVRIQMPLVLGLQSDPVPDVSVVPGSLEEYATRQPTTAVLTLEVADTSLAFDLGKKAAAYAAGGIADYWVADVNGQRLIVHRDPVPDSTSESGHRYATVRTLHLGEAVATLAVPTVEIAVDELLK